MLNKEFVKDIDNNKYEITDNGELFLPNSKVKIGGYFTHWINDEKPFVDHNLVVNEGLNYILGSALAGGTADTTHYIGLYSNNYTPLATSIMSSATAANNFVDVSKANEVTTAYNEATRQTWTVVTPTSQVVTNVASPAAFTANTNVTVYGAFLVGGSGSNVKGSSGTTQKLIAASLFSAPRALINTDVLNITYQLTITSV